jgi:hypothetical protein
MMNERAAYVQGLRELADFVEAHPDLPVPFSGSHNVFLADKADVVALARAAGGRWEKGADPNYFYLKVRFAGGHTYDLNVDRERICRKVVTGTRTVPATPAHDVEEFHWICDEPLLAHAVGQ